MIEHSPLITRGYGGQNFIVTRGYSNILKRVWREVIRVSGPIELRLSRVSLITHRTYVGVSNMVRRLTVESGVTFKRVWKMVSEVVTRMIIKSRIRK